MTMKHAEIFRYADVVITQCAAVQKGEQVLVVSDTFADQSISQALVGAALARGAEANLIVYPARKQSPHEPPQAVVEAMKASDVVFLYTGSSLTHSRARRAAQEAGARVIVMAGVDEDVFLRTVAVDLKSVADLTQRVSDCIGAARQARLTSTLGTDLTMELGHPIVIIDGLCHNRAEIDFIPFGTMVTVPRVRSANGTVVVDGSIGALGVLSAPVTLTIEASRLIDIQGGKDASRLRNLLATADDPNVYNCPAEWGVGTNPGARLIGVEPTFEGERIFGWAHIALGNNDVFPGGETHAKLHLDAIISEPVLELDRRVIMADGQFKL
jgi:leucyl aminopeptidase (aminopeptidase T)